MEYIGERFGQKLSFVLPISVNHLNGLFKEFKSEV